MSAWLEHFPGLASLEPEVRRPLVERSRVANLPRGTVLFGPGKPPENLVLLLSGTVRVQQVADSGREIVLYRVQAGESCVLTTACLFAYEDYEAEGLAETALEAVLIPRPVFDDLIAASSSFREFVFRAYSRRITDLLMVIQEIAFGRIDLRLAQKLIDLAGGGLTLTTTHQQLATELGTAREVISRQLQDFQKRGWVTVSRGAITLRDRPALSRFATTQ